MNWRLDEITSGLLVAASEDTLDFPAKVEELGLEVQTMIPGHRQLGTWTI